MEYDRESETAKYVDGVESVRNTHAVQIPTAHHLRNRSLGVTSYFQGRGRIVWGQGKRHNAELRTLH